MVREKVRLNFRKKEALESVMCDVKKIHLKGAMREVGKETPKKGIDLDVYLWRHTWNFPALQEKYLKQSPFFSQNHSKRKKS